MRVFDVTAGSQQELRRRRAQSPQPDEASRQSNL